MKWCSTNAKILAWLFCFLAAMVTHNAHAAPAESSCLLAIKRVAQETGVPHSLLKETYASENNESAPWTVGMAGKEYNFTTPEAAKAWLFTRYIRGERDFFVGCFQLSFRRFHQYFENLEEMFDPYKNSKIFAHEIISLRSKYGSWKIALSIYQASHPNVAQWNRVDSFSPTFVF